MPEVSTKKEEIDKEALRGLALVEQVRTENKLYNMFDTILDPSHPDEGGAYPWQVEFFEAGATNQERCLCAGNRVGKTTTAAAEIALHLIGEYPKWWTGKRFDRGINVWIGSESTEASRDVVQLALLGPEGFHGTGMIPKKKLIGKARYRQAGVTEVVDIIHIRHSSGGVSTCSFKMYEQGRAKWQGKALDIIWLDEEPPPEIFTESLTRVLDRKGMVILTFTPLLGPSDVVRHFLEPPAKGIYIKNVTWDDAPHLEKAEKDRLWDSYPPHERETRAKGMPMLGTGAVFPIGDDAITVDSFELPSHWARINGLDFGIDHPGAGSFCAHDRDTDTFYVYDCYRVAGHTPIYHAAAMKKHGDWIPNAWPHDGLIRDKGSGEVLKDQYRKHGLYVLPEHAQYRDERGNHTEPGLIEIYEYMRTGKFKVFRHLSQWLEEKRLYHRKDGKIVAEHDDIISATRYAFIMRRYATTPPVLTAQRPAYDGPILGERRWRTGG